MDSVERDVGKKWFIEIVCFDYLCKLSADQFRGVPVFKEDLFVAMPVIVTLSALFSILTPLP
jgi:hypothetical protein